MMVTGTTAVVGIVGTPIIQVKMPGEMNRYFAENGLDVVLIPMDVAPAGIPALLQAVRAWNNLRGLIVTVPFKQVVAASADRLTDRAARLTTANVVRRDPDGTLTGDILDGVGFIEAARANGCPPEGKAAAVIGAGGVASAIANSLCENGVARLAIRDVDTAKQDRLIATLRQAFPRIEITGGIERVDDLDLLVNGTPVGMNGDPSLPLPDAVLSGLGRRCHVADVVTAPLMTPFLERARIAGCTIQTGIEMTKPQLLPMARFLGVAA
jgi:shikimate dehydrogenase